MKDAVVLYPSPGIGHLISMVELAKLILEQYPSFSINILISTPPYNTGATAPYIRRVSDAAPSINFHHLPAPSLPSDPASYSSIEAIGFDFLRRNNPNVHRALLSISETHTIVAFIIDLFCAPSLVVARDLNISVYFFFTSGAACLALFLHLPTLHRSTTKSFKDLQTLLHVPSLPPIPSSDMPAPTLVRTSVECTSLVDFSAQMTKSAGIIVNTFQSLESKHIKAASDGLCVPDEPTPPIFAIGPLVAANDRTGGESEDGATRCLAWLDSQPSQSVVFLCFGSLGVFSEAQLKEIAVGLENSGQRFLWVVRSPPTEDGGSCDNLAPPPDPDLDSLLPEGFLGRTRERGLVVKKWAPQVAVLSHESVGGFVTHCGWNSVLEAVCAGVPMVAWPLYAEQRFNRVVLVEEMKLAVPMEERTEDGFVTAAEVEKRVTELMDSEVGNRVRERAVGMKEEAAGAMRDGGSSHIALTKLVELWGVKN
ncbi:UDP-glycosyltransferase 88A1-like [Malania oleifera]|uniref:UDP-glycosyltransferase 88A1-like n=1 Tax=Malania oleifera TaxID=397392 RepID=UPI0025ADD3E8|nr:UDP-glycosyltransferase 88A1-like [Malania oleifera]